MPPTSRKAGKQPAPASAATVKPGKDKAKDKKGKSSSENHRLYYLAGSAGLLLVMLLVGSAHMMKRARRARRLAAAARAAAGEPDPEPEAPTWVVSEQAMTLAIGALLAAIIFGSATVAIGQRVLAARRVRKAAVDEKLAAKSATAARKAALFDAKAAFAVAKSKARARNEEERKAQKEFEEQLLADIKEHERRVAEAAAAEAAIAKADAEAARREARRIEEELHAKTRWAPAAGSGGSGSGAYSGDGNEWDVGDYDEATAGDYEDDGEEGVTGDAAGGVAVVVDGAAGGGGGGGDDSDDDRVPAASDRVALELHPERSTRGTRITLEGLALPESATGRAADLSLLLACNKCSKTIDVGASGLSTSEATRKSWCESCGSLLSATVRPCLVHGSNDILGHVDVIGCTLADVPRLSVLVGCGRCDAELTLPPLQRGRSVQAGCRQCHAPLSCKIGNIGLERLGGLSGGGGGKGSAADDDDELEALLKKCRKKNLDQFKTMGLVVGKPLPNKGACRHFAHSYRWLRFPCCGRAHPCATCHAESDCPASELGVWANRMLCGKCSREMPYADTPCGHCGNTFMKPGGAHWQGGAGCRDQQRLSMSDSRKYKGASATGVKKTTSQKGQRVGTAGKKATLAKKVAHGA